ncbi:MAG: enoyl-CoA hydratase/isomerase family protein [Candidatus Tectomicrobia bacterium]|uniref:Enoyl-CoA hydratase/isomerase family protein n=1 Tax=Tectimicrobiota bacterium TaxID=2528274 RepID=A0A933LPI8_UNCTE|nr:enoyl-CoA hydratase/isomerase family protein [Candidatus Tectomicrobia bacterium]
MGFVDYERKNAIVFITMNRPERLNAFGSAINNGLKESFARFQSDDQARVAILRGAGRAFCAGIDVKEVAAGGMFLDNPLTCLYPYGSLDLSKPVIAAINGYCLGAGFNLLAMQADLRVAAEDAIFGLPELERGIYCLSTMFCNQLPRNIILELALLCNYIPAQRAYDLGIINRLVPSEGLLAEATAMAEKLSTLPSETVRLTRETVFRMTRAGDDAKVQENWYFNKSAASREMAERMKEWAARSQGK